MNKNYRDIHSSFKLNGITFSFEDLKEVGYCLIKEGLPFENAIGNFLIDWVNDADFIHVNTSGSTGLPKLIKLQKQHMVNSAIATGSFFNLKPTNTALLCLPANFIAGKMMLVRAMVLGLQLDYVEPNSSPLKNVTKAYDFGAMIPLQVENSIKNIQNIKTLLIGGAKVSEDLKELLQKKKIKVFETYGMTETITHIAAKTINTQNFKALPEVTFSIDHRGCLMIHAPSILEHDIITNDLVQLISNTEFQWLGRLDSVINSGGVKLIPEKIEEKLSPLIKQNYFVAGLPDKKLGEKLVLVVESNTEIATILSEIQRLKTLKKFEIPKQIFFIPEFISTGNGKIQRTETLKLL